MSQFVVPQPTPAQFQALESYFSGLPPAVALVTANNFVASIEALANAYNASATSNYNSNTVPTYQQRVISTGVAEAPPVPPNAQSVDWSSRPAGPGTQGQPWDQGQLPQIVTLANTPVCDQCVVQTVPPPPVVGVVSVNWAGVGDFGTAMFVPCTQTDTVQPGTREFLMNMTANPPQVYPNALRLGSPVGNGYYWLNPTA